MAARREGENPVAKHLEVVTHDATPPVWAALRNQAEHAAKAEPALASLLNAVILSHDNLADALTFQLARKLGDLCENTSNILAIELLAAAQGVDLRAPFETSPKLRSVMQEIRSRVPHYDIDRYLAPDIAAITEAVRAGVIAAHCPVIG